MPKTSVRPSATLGSFLRKRRKELGFTLVEVSDTLAKKRERIPPSTLARIEQGKLDPGVRRLQHLLHLYRIPPQLVLDVVAMEDLATGEPKGHDVETLLREGVEAWKRGDPARGLACLFAIQRLTRDDPEARATRQHALLTFATVARDFGRIKLAKQFVDDLFAEPPVPELRVQVLVLAASVWRGIGSHDPAAGMIRQAEAIVPQGDAKLVGWVKHQAARIALDGGRVAETEAAIGAAIDAYSATGDTYNAGKARLLRIELLEKQGHPDDAVAEARRVIDDAELEGHARVATGGRIELGRLLVARGETAGAVEALREALGRAVLIEDNNLQFFAHYHLWKAFLAEGDRDRARFELQAACYFVRFIDAISAEAEEIRRLCGKDRS